MNALPVLYDFVLGYFREYGVLVVVTLLVYVITTRWRNADAKKRYARMLPVLEQAIATASEGTGIAADVTTQQLLKLFDAGASNDALSPHNACTQLAVLYLQRWETRCALDRLKKEDEYLEEQEQLLRVAA
ncbi:hypothetical protein [Bordetella sp. LUAb4]|uniref:hypothetical protein n=1 Tax=Bordetella sp. LUAb4 TaxID=2843195 RepID=UPI001E5411DB|nr:hypothetical protein [Bordetella sp. LUAb4]